MKCTVIGEADIIGMEDVAVIEREFIESDDSEFTIQLSKETTDGTMYGYSGAGSTSIQFLSGSVGTKWSEIEETGTELYEIVAIKDIQVPAGSFPSCYIVANWKISHDDGSVMSYDERWWHPGTGYVKLNMHIGLGDEQNIVLIDYMMLSGTSNKNPWNIFLPAILNSSEKQ